MKTKEAKIKELETRNAQIESASPRTVTRTLPAPEPEKRCWISNHFGLPNSTIKGAVTATAVIIHCNHMIDAPFVIQVEFDRDFIPGATVLPDSGIVTGGGEGKKGKICVTQINSPALLSDQLAVVTVYGETDQYPRALRGGIKTLMQGAASVFSWDKTKQTVAPLLYHPIVDCRVYFRDALGVEHSTEVRARSLYEAVCRGWAAFMFSGGWDLFEASWKAHEFIVVADSKTYRVDRDKFLEWLSKDRDSSARKKYLRQVLDGLAD